MRTEPGPTSVATITEIHMSNEFPIARLRHTSACRRQGSRSHVALAPSPRATATSSSIQAVEDAASAHDSVTSASTAAITETIQDGAGAPVCLPEGSGSASPWGPTR